MSYLNIVFLFHGDVIIAGFFQELFYLLKLCEASAQLSEDCQVRVSLFVFGNISSSSMPDVLRSTCFFSHSFSILGTAPPLNL